MMPFVLQENFCKNENTWKVCRRILREEGQWKEEEKEGEAHDRRLSQNISEIEKSHMYVYF